MNDKKIKTVFDNKEKYIELMEKIATKRNLESDIEQFMEKLKALDKEDIQTYYVLLDACTRFFVDCFEKNKQLLKLKMIVERIWADMMFYINNNPDMYFMFPQEKVKEVYDVYFYDFISMFTKFTFRKQYLIKDRRLLALSQAMLFDIIWASGAYIGQLGLFVDKPTKLDAVRSKTAENVLIEALDMLNIGDDIKDVEAFKQYIAMILSHYQLQHTNPYYMKYIVALLKFLVSDLKSKNVLNISSSAYEVVASNTCGTQLGFNVMALTKLIEKTYEDSTVSVENYYVVERLGMAEKSHYTDDFDERFFDRYADNTDELYDLKEMVERKDVSIHKTFEDFMNMDIKNEERKLE